MKLYFAIKFKSSFIDDIADKMQIKGTLKSGHLSMPFNKHMKDDFCTFDSRQRMTCIQSFLQEQIDFDYFADIGVIDEHYPLHRMEAQTEL